MYTIYIVGNRKKLSTIFYTLPPTFSLSSYVKVVKMFSSYALIDYSTQKVFPKTYTENKMFKTRNGKKINKTISVFFFFCYIFRVKRNENHFYKRFIYPLRFVYSVVRVRRPGFRGQVKFASCPIK